MRIEQMLVMDFHSKFGVTINSNPTICNTATRDLRIKLIGEEFLEFVTGCARGDIVEMADALGDLLYVVYGACVTFGIDSSRIFDEIQRSNMTKIWPDGTVKRNDYGKILKPPTYSKANIKDSMYILERK